MIRALHGAPGRAVALVLAIAAATAAFIVLTGRVNVRRLELRGQVAAAGRDSYDILVRPAGARSGLEASRGLVRADFLAGQFGGISLAQDRAIAGLPGVEVAAPVAMVGYVLQTVTVPIDITDALEPGQRQLFAASVRRHTDQGLSTFDEPDVSYTYVTPVQLTTTTLPSGGGAYGVTETDARGRSTVVCPHSVAPAAGPFTIDNQRVGTCWSTANGPDGEGFTLLPEGHIGIVLRWTFPFLLAAVDPDQEARLVGLDRSVTRGHYLPERADGSPTVPVLLANRANLDDEDTVAIDRLPDAAAAQYAAGLSPAGIDALLARFTGTPVRDATVTAAQAYQQLLTQYLDRGAQTTVDSYWTTGPVRYDAGSGDVLHPQTVTNSDQVWRSQLRDRGYDAPPPEAQDTALRTLSAHTALATGRDTDQPAPVLAVVGAFDPDAVSGIVGHQSPLGAYGASALTGADARSRALLGGRALLPDSDIAGYSLAAPTMLAPLSAIGGFTDPHSFTGVTPGDPISAIRVRVAGVTGTDPVSRERVRVVADAISRTTSLDVDVTLGSSPTTLAVALPAGAHGRPALLVAEQWQRKGVATEILRAVDRESLLLFLLVLGVCGLFVGNATAAAVRDRRTELAIRSCLGHTRGRLLRLLLYEIGLFALGAGVCGGALAWLDGAVFGPPMPVARAVAAIPCALAVALVSAAWPAWRASRPPPLFTLSTVDGGALGVGTGGLPRMAITGLLRMPARTATGVVSVAVACAGLTTLAAITLAFRGSVVGSVLGDAVSLRARGIDFLAAGVTLLLAAFAVADAAYLSLRDRAGELAALSAAGWTDGELRRLVGAEAVLTGALGAVLGAVLGVAVAATLAGALPAVLLAVAALTGASATLATVLATLVPVRALRRLPVTRLLARD